MNKKKTPPRETEGLVLSAQTREPDRVTFGKPACARASVTVAAAAAAAIGRADGSRPPPPPFAVTADPAKYLPYALV